MCLFTEIQQPWLQNSNGGDFFIVEPNIESHSIFKLTESKYAVKKADIVAEFYINIF